MTAQKTARKALESTKDLMAQCAEDEQIVLEAFADAFDAELEGWNMRLEELREG